MKTLLSKLRPLFRIGRLSVSQPVVLLSRNLIRAVRCFVMNFDFLGRGYAKGARKIFGKLGEGTFSVNFQFNIKTRQFGDGLIFWQGQKDATYLSGALKNRKMTFEIQLDSNTKVNLESNSAVNDDSVHEIELFLSPTLAKLTVDGEKMDEKPTGKPLNIVFFDLFVGGHENDINSVTGGEFSNGFNGCLTGLKVNYEPIVNDQSLVPFESELPFNSDRLFPKTVNMQCSETCQ